MNKLFAIGIPTINRWDLLRPSLQKYMGIDFCNTWFFVVDNGNQVIDIEHPIFIII